MNKKMRARQVSDCIRCLTDAREGALDLRLMQLLYNAGIFGEVEEIDGCMYIKDPYNIDDDTVYLKLMGYAAGNKTNYTKRIDWESIKKTPLYVPSERVPIDNAKYIIYKGDRNFNGTILPVFFYLYIPYCTNEEKTFGMDFVPNEYIPKERDKHLTGCTCYDDGVYAVDLEYASRDESHPD